MFKKINPRDAEFICNLVAAGFAAISVAMAAIGQYAKNKNNEGEN